MATFQKAIIYVILVTHFTIFILSVDGFISIEETVSQVIHTSRKIKDGIKKSEQDADPKSLEYETVMSLENLSVLEPIDVNVTVESTEKDERNENSIQVWDCGSPGVYLKSCSINGCTGDPCYVRRGQAIILNVTFSPKVRASKLWCDIYAKKGLIVRHFGCPQSNMCNTPGLDCPLQLGKSYTFTVKKTVSPKIPQWTWYIQGQLWDENGHSFLCIGAHAKVT